ncbi:unnamed protein product [Parascedosporium putredinis]|uniref:Clock-controlled protein 6 n=1 Tax=Parascedosporium putredinis TaxID=1442378 RepID=A0A9P1H373_9PEZI|nr:unnamed protein product [Parascedosporium putredinis]CAI7995597.1 unnamed protein product [Parascedosporium putredinis]
MKYAAVLALAGLAAAGAVPAQNGTVYTTEVVTAYTTYCPEATTITDGDNTITITEPTVVTITHCPGGCTIKKPVVTTSAPVTAGAAKLAGAGLAAFLGAVAFL